jgi:hypothetical protein
LSASWLLGGLGNAISGGDDGPEAARRGFVPEAQVYLTSPKGIDLDTGQEAWCLQDLACALGLSTSTVNDIHDRQSAPRIIR